MLTKEIVADYLRYRRAGFTPVESISIARTKAEPKSGMIGGPISITEEPDWDKHFERLRKLGEDFARERERKLLETMSRNLWEYVGRRR